MQQEHQETNDSHPTIITTTSPHRHAAHRAFLSLSLSFLLFFSPRAGHAGLSSLSLSISLSLSRSALFLEIPSRSTASLRLLPFGSLGDTARSKHALHCRNFCASSRRLRLQDQSLAFRAFLYEVVTESVGELIKGSNICPKEMSPNIEMLNLSNLEKFTLRKASLLKCLLLSDKNPILSKCSRLTLSLVDCLSEVCEAANHVSIDACFQFDKFLRIIFI